MDIEDCRVESAFSKSRMRWLIVSTCVYRLAVSGDLKCGSEQDKGSTYYLLMHRFICAGDVSVGHTDLHPLLMHELQGIWRCD